MKFYQLDFGQHVAPSYCEKFLDAKAITRNMLGVAREEVRVYLVEIPTDKATLVLVLNGHAAAVPGAKRLRQWRVTGKHRYIEIPVDED